ncbi:MAG: hypothetical protein OXH79_18250 [Boseongicola sp.]|nr:hypothetical protein [Boseongicola sp.]
MNAVEWFLWNPGYRGAMAARGSSERAEQARRERAHRLILLDALVLMQREKLEETCDQVASELAGVLERRKRVERNNALLTDVLGK